MALTVQLLFFLLTSVMMNFADGALTPHNSLRFIGIGYSLLDGNPQGRHGLGGLDPGFRETHRVVQLTYNQNKRSRDGKNSVADQVTFADRLGCSAILKRQERTLEPKAIKAT